MKMMVGGDEIKIDLEELDPTFSKEGDLIDPTYKHKMDEFIAVRNSELQQWNTNDILKIQQ
jgi:hypothetical protein